jgi:hypothetical protein
MPVTIDQTHIDDLVARPTESLNVEIKRWINPDGPEGEAKIALAALAIHNRNGGFLIIGFDDKTLQPDAGNEPGDVRTAFHIDKIQRIVSRYTSELFEVAVGFGKRDGVEHPVIVVPEGVRVPVAAKTELKDAKGKILSSVATFISGRWVQTELSAQHQRDHRTGVKLWKYALRTARRILADFCDGTSGTGTSAPCLCSFPRLRPLYSHSLRCGIALKRF